MILLLPAWASRGEALFLPEVIARALNQPSVEKTRSENSVLTERELEVLKAAARGEALFLPGMIARMISRMLRNEARIPF